MNSILDQTDPMRHPEHASNTERTKRAVLLLVLSFFMPGAAHIAAGRRSFGRKALIVTFLAWLLAIVVILLALFKRETLINLATGKFSVVCAAVLIILALYWLFMMLSTLALIKVRLLAPGLRLVTCAVVLVLAFAPAAAMMYSAYLLNVTRGAVSKIFQASGPAIKPVDGRYNFLLMGGDAGEDRSGRRPDSIVVFSVDAKTGQASTISIPRNLQNAPFPADSPLRKVYPDGYDCGDDCIINSLYTDVTNDHKDLYPDAKDPGAQATMDAAEGVLGIKIQSYIIVDMAGFQKLIDAVGGIDVNNGGWVPIEYYDVPGSDPSNPQKFPPKEWIGPGKKHLDGRQALWYARSRYLSTDYERIRRQQCVQQAMIKQLNPQTLLARFEDVANAGTQVMETDLPQDQLGSFMNLALKARGQNVARLTVGPPDMGDNMFTTYPDFNLIHQRVHDFLYPSQQKDQKPAAPKPPAANNDGGSGQDGADQAAPEQGSDAQAPANQDGAPTPDPEQPSTDPNSLSEKQLRDLADAGDTETLVALISPNGNCTPA